MSDVSSIAFDLKSDLDLDPIGIETGVPNWGLRKFCPCPAETDVNGPSLPMDTLLYVGAGADAFPLTCPELRRRFPLIVYTDMRSDSGILEELCTRGGSFAGLASDKFTHQPGGAYSAQLPDGCTFVYYLNCSLVSRVPPTVLTDVTTLYLHGNRHRMEPLPGIGFLESLPNVRFCYSTNACVGPLYWGIYSRSGLPIFEWNATTHTDEWVWADAVGFRRYFTSSDVQDTFDGRR